MSFEIIDSLFENLNCVDNEFDVLFDREDLNKGDLVLFRIYLCILLVVSFFLYIIDRDKK